MESFRLHKAMTDLLFKLRFKASTCSWGPIMFKGLTVHYQFDYEHEHSTKKTLVLVLARALKISRSLCLNSDEIHRLDFLLVVPQNTYSLAVDSTGMD